MSRNGMFVGSGRLFITVAVAAVSLMAATSPVGANVEPAEAWPSFHEGLSHEKPQQQPPLEPPFVWTANGEIRTTAAVHAPLPPAVATGVFILGCNWVATRLWKKRKI